MTSPDALGDEVAEDALDPRVATRPARTNSTGDALAAEVSRRIAEQVAASVARRTRQRAVRAALAARRAVGLQRRHARKEKAMATDSKPCGCGDGLLCLQHILLLPAGRRRAPRRERCRAGLHSPNCPPSTCPERKP